MKFAVDLIDKLLKYNNDNLGKHNEYILFGASSLGERAFEFLKNNNKKVAYFCDNDRLKWGRKFLGIDIISPNELLTKMKDYSIVITSSYHKEIANQLEEMKVDNFYFFKKIIEIKGIDELEGIDLNNDFNNKRLILSNNQCTDVEIEIKKKIDTIIKNQPIIHDKALKKVREKAKHKKIKVAFFVLDYVSWKLENVYRKMSENRRFDPIVVVCPTVRYGDKSEMIKKIEDAYEFFCERGYNVIRAYDKRNDNYLDIRKEISPDIIFYTNPYKGLIDDRYYITRFKDILACYVHYGYQSTSLTEITYNGILSQLVWKFFLETEIHLKIMKNTARNKGINGVVTGYPLVDNFVFKERIENNVWKNSDKSLKRVIWAPHHTISNTEGWLNYSNFFKYHNYMLEIAEKYNNLIQIAFRPHPLLRFKLYNHPDWGKEKTDKYYQRWEQGSNTQLSVGYYVDLFNSSDALIHDCGSFIAEYLHCGKPVLYLLKDKSYKEYNEFGIMVLSQHYHGYFEEDIEKFIKEVVIDGNDIMETSRTQFYYNVLRTEQNSNASENIYKIICKKLNVED